TSRSISENTLALVGRLEKMVDQTFAPVPVTPPTFSFAASNQPLVGMIGSGLAPNNPDIDYSKVTWAQDSTNVNNGPALPEGEANENSTDILEIIAAKRDNGIGIDGINPDAPIWVGGAVGPETWMESLVEFVDATRQSGQPNAVVNLNLDLTQVDAQGNVTTRYQLTPQEREAIEYARQHNVLIVVPAGNEPGQISALGNASLEFDNVVTVGAATRVNDAVALSKAYDAPDDSGSGIALDLITDGNSYEAPAKVTGAISQVWAANPRLNYTQVIDIIKRTATDLGQPNWDSRTGAGLLNITAAITLAKATEPEPYTVKPGQRTITDNFVSSNPENKPLPGDPTHPAATVPSIPKTTVDTGGNSIEKATQLLMSPTVDIIDQVSSIDPVDVFRMEGRYLHGADFSVLDGELSIKYLTPDGKLLGTQVLGKGSHTLELPGNVSGEVLMKVEPRNEHPATYMLYGFESTEPQPFNIDLEFDSPLTASQKKILEAAAKNVASLIGQGLPTAIVDGKIIDDINIKISTADLDAAGGTQARTKIDFMRYGSLLPAQSLVQLDATDIAELEQSGSLFDVAQHEFLHALGFGNLWEAKGLVNYAGTPLAQYNGKNAVDEFQKAGGLKDTVALETEGNGSASLHWHQQLFPDEIMTADLNGFTGEPAPISAVTIASLADLGYVVNLDRATPGYQLFGGQTFDAEDLTPEQIEAFRQLAEMSFEDSDADYEYIAPIMPTVDPDKVAPEIWAHAERFWKNGDYYDWVRHQIRPNEFISHITQRTMGNGVDSDYWAFVGNKNGLANVHRIAAGDWIWIPQHHPNYEQKQEQERLRREAELRQRQEEEARIRREQEEAFAREQERVRQEAEARRREAEAKQRELEEQERRLREEMERRRQEEERRLEEARLAELARQAEIARQQGKGGLDWYIAKPLPEFGPVDPFETRLTGETVGNLVPDDYYRFTLSRGGRITAELRQLLADADLVLYDVRNRPIAYSMREGITDEHIIADLIPGTYMLRVNSPKGVTTDYELIVKFKHKLSQSELGLPGWNPGESGGSGGGAAAGSLFSDPRIQRIYDTALNNFAGPERAKANTRIAELEREKRSYEQEMKALLDQMNAEQRKKVNDALDRARNDARNWVDGIANPIKNTVDSLGNGIKNKADSFANTLLSKIDNIWDFGNGWIKDRKEDARKLVRQGRNAVKSAVNNAQSWLKGQLEAIQNSVKSAISTFFEAVKNAYRTGAEINQAIASAANSFRSAVDRAVSGANDLVGKFKGQVLSAVEWTKNLGIKVDKFGVKFEFNAYNQLVKPAVDAIASGVSSTINGIGNSLKGITNWLEPRTQKAVADIVNALLGDKTGHLWNKIHGVDAKIAATRTGLEKVLSAAKQHIANFARKIDAFLSDPEERKRVLEALWKWGFKTIEDAYNFIVKKRDEVRKEIEAEREARRKAEEEARRKAEAKRKAEEEEAQRKAEEEAWLNESTKLTPAQENLFKQVMLRGNPQLIADYDFLKNVAQSRLTSLHTFSGVNLPKEADPLSKEFLNDPGTLLKKFSYMQILENKLGMGTIEQAQKAYERLGNAIDSYSFNDPVFENTVSSNAIKIVEQNYSELNQITEKFQALYYFNFGNALLDAANGIYRSIGLGVNLSRIFLEVKSGGFRTAKSAFEALPDLTQEQIMTEKAKDMYDLVKTIYETPILEALESALNGDFDKLFEQLPSLFSNTADLMSKIAKDENIKLSSSVLSEFVNAVTSMESFGNLSRLLNTLKSSNLTHINSDDISFVSTSKIYSGLTTLFSIIKTFSALFKLFFHSKTAAGINFAVQGKTTYLNEIVDVADSLKVALWSVFEEWNSSNMRIQNGMYSCFTEYNHSAIKAAQKAITYIAQAASSRL
ncbi:S8 family serine peptidase, partial [Phormidium pseudopriestleyi FRX01]|nr:S8 family serine peptidase [Phormidium pseudopriestleyi FRX01]